MHSRLTTLDKKGKRLWIYPQDIKGIFTKYRTYVAHILIALYLIMPWIQVGGKQSLLFNIPARQFIIFGTTFWPQDINLFFFVIAIGAFSLFFFTALFGRIWCGWACPQTVFLEFFFRKIENFIEGNRIQRKRLDQGPWTKEKLLKKTVKHILFAAFSFLIANTFVAYFVGANKLLSWFFENPLEHWTAFLVMFANFCVFYFNFGWFREQFCTLLCPYARFQTVMTDNDSLQVTYNFKRGEPRGKLNKTEGDCITCDQCVKVCPTGIDIRDGHQLECIGCTKCIDACDRMMEKVGLPKKLISYASQNTIEGKRQTFLRPRVFIYSFLLIALVFTFIFLVKTRDLLNLTIVRPAGVPYSLLRKELVSNRFHVKLINKDQKILRVRLVVKEGKGLKLISPFPLITLEPNTLRKTDIFVTAPLSTFKNGVFQTQVMALDQETKLLGKITVTLLGPSQ